MSDLKGRVCEAVDRLEEKLRGVSRFIYENPELKFEEVRAAGSM